MSASKKLDLTVEVINSEGFFEWQFSIDRVLNERSWFDHSPPFVPFIFLLRGISSSEEDMIRISSAETSLEVENGRARYV